MQDQKDAQEMPKWARYILAKWEELETKKAGTHRQGKEKEGV